MKIMLNNEYVSIKELFLFEILIHPWPDFIEPWQADGPVPENDWTGRFKIVFSNFQII